MNEKTRVLYPCFQCLQIGKIEDGFQGIAALFQGGFVADDADIIVFIDILEDSDRFFDIPEVTTKDLVEDPALVFIAVVHHVFHVGGQDGTLGRQQRIEFSGRADDVVFDAGGPFKELFQVVDCLFVDIQGIGRIGIPEGVETCRSGDAGAESAAVGTAFDTDIGPQIVIGQDIGQDEHRTDLILAAVKHGTLGGIGDVGRYGDAFVSSAQRLYPVGFADRSFTKSLEQISFSFAM